MNPKFLKDLKVVFWYIFDTVSRLTRRDSHLSLQLICTPVDLWKLGLGAPGLLDVSFAQTREEEIASTLRTNRISETWYDMTTKNNNITKLWESCLPILGPSPDCVRDAHVRWISTTTTSNGLDKRGWLSKQMLADVGRCWQGLRTRDKNLQKCHLIHSLIYC